MAALPSQAAVLPIPEMTQYKKRKTQLKRAYGQDVQYASEHEARRRRRGNAARDDRSSISGGGQNGAQAKGDAPLAAAGGSLGISNDSDDYDELAALAMTHVSDFPPEMRKYWKQRQRLFSLFDGSSPTGRVPLLDREGWYSVTPEPIAARIAQRCRSSVVLDAYCGVGGNAIQFALTCERVIAIDTDPVKLRMARHNASIYGVDSFITFLQGDWRDFAQDWQAARAEKDSDSADAVSASASTSGKWQGAEALSIDVVFLSPPWGGVDYRQLSTPQKGIAVEATTPDAKLQGEPLEDATQTAPMDYYPLAMLAPTGAHDMLALARRITANVCMFVPRNVDLTDLAALSLSARASSAALPSTTQSQEDVLVDVEEQWLGGRCKALACYFGDLIDYMPEQEQ